MGNLGHYFIKKKFLLNEDLTQMELDYARNNTFSIFKSVSELEGNKSKTLTLTQDKNGVKHAALESLGYTREAFHSPPEQRVSSCPDILKSYLKHHRK